MTDNKRFGPAGIRPAAPASGGKRKRKPVFPRASVIVLSLLILCCLFAELLMTGDPGYLDLKNCNVPPNARFLFGTDTLGRDIFSGIWYGGRISMAVGFLATLISTAIALVYGTVSGLAPGWLDAGMTRFAEIFLSIPGLLLALFLQALLGESNILTLSAVIGATGWPGIARVVRTEVRQLRSSGYVEAAKTMGGGFFHILRRHLAPNFIAPIMFMVVMNVRGAILAEATLSFMGMGLPLEIISLGSMLSLAEKALLTASWWSILIPGAFLLTLLMCLTDIGSGLRENANRKERSL